MNFVVVLLDAGIRRRGGRDLLPRLVISSTDLSSRFCFVFNVGPLSRFEYIERCSANTGSIADGDPSWLFPSDKD